MSWTFTIIPSGTKKGCGKMTDRYDARAEHWWNGINSKVLGSTHHMSSSGNTVKGKPWVRRNDWPLSADEWLSHSGWWPWNRNSAVNPVWLYEPNEPIGCLLPQIIFRVPKKFKMLIKLSGLAHVVRAIVQVTVGAHQSEIINALLSTGISLTIDFLLYCSHIHWFCNNWVIILQKNTEKVNRKTHKN